MKILLNLEVITLGAIIAQGFFAGSLLFFFKNNNQANRFLAVLLILFSLWLCDTFFRVSGIYNQNPNFYFLPIYFSFAFGPLIYFYTRALTERQFQIKSSQLLHFLPVLFQLLFYTFLQVKDYEFRRWFWMEIHSPYTYDLEFILSLLSILIYLAMSLKSVKIYQDWIKNNYSDISQIKLNWLRFIHILLLLLSILWIIDASTRYFTDYYADKPLSAISIGSSILFLAIGGLLQKDLSDIRNENESNKLTSNSTDLGSLDSSLLSKIQQAMEVDKLYLKNELTLKEFAKKLNEPSRKISRHINLGLSLSFIDFVNSYRVKNVKKQILKGDTERLSLFGIALESGFNSKPTFNRVFKKLLEKALQSTKKRFKTGFDRSQSMY